MSIKRVLGTSFTCITLLATPLAADASGGKHGRSRRGKCGRPRVLYTSRTPAKVNVDIVTWGVKREHQRHTVDPTKVTIDGLPRGACATLAVQEKSHPLRFGRLLGEKGKGKGKHEGKGRLAEPSLFGALRRGIAATTNLREVWATNNASPELGSSQLADTWHGSRVLPINQPYLLEWNHEAKASGPEDRSIQGSVQGLKTEHERVNTGARSSVLITRSGQLGAKFAGFIQRANLLKTDAFRDGKQTFVKVKGLRALPAGATFVVRNLATGETVSGKASRSGSFNARVPVRENAEQMLELTIRLVDKTGIESTLTRSLGHVTFARARQRDREIGYHYVAAKGRRMPHISANVRGATVAPRKVRGLAKPRVTLAHKLIAGQPERGTMFNFHGAKMYTDLTLSNISADTHIKVLQQQPPGNDGKAAWVEVGSAKVLTAANDSGQHSVRLDKAIVPHTPLKLLIKRPGERKTHVVLASMPSPGERPTGNWFGADYVYKAKYTSWVKPESVRRTVAYQGHDGKSRVRVQGKLTAPATSRVTIVNETAGTRSPTVTMRERFATTVRAKPGHKLKLEVAHASGEVETKALGIVPDAVEASYQPSGLHFFPFTQNHIK